MPRLEAIRVDTVSHCGSEFIREGPVQATYLYRLCGCLANEFAPTAVMRQPPESCSDPKLTRRHATPANERMPKARRFTEPQDFGDVVNRQLIVLQQLLGPLEA